MSTPSIKETAAAVELRAVVRDITAVSGDDAYDYFAGNITTAKVSFVNLNNNGVIEENVQVYLLDPGDSKTGVAVFNWEVDLGNKDSEAFTIGLNVDGLYIGEEKTVVTVSKPLDDFMTGGGYLINQGSGGVYAGDPGLKANFGFSVKFNKKLTNLQGNFTAIVRNGGHVYQINSNATQSLVVDPVTKEATFVSKANLIDITDPDNPIEIAGNLSLIVSLRDGEKFGEDDLIGFTLWNKNQLWFPSNWTGTNTTEQTLSGGNVVVHAGAGQTAAVPAPDGGDPDRRDAGTDRG
jgi:hypothetical protein